MSETITPIDEPLMARILRLASPAFRVSPPELEGADLVPADILGMMNHSWSKGIVPVRPVTFYRLRNVYVCAEGLVFDEAFNLYRSTIAQHPPAYVAEALRTLRERHAAGGVPTHREPTLLCKKIGSFNYGHWLVEMLPRAQLAKAHLNISDLRYLVHAVAGPMRAVMRDSLALLGIQPSTVVQTANEPHFFSELIIVDGLSRHGGYMSPLCLDALDQVAAMVRTGHSERVFVTRQSAEWRKFQNEDEMADIALRAGYSLVDPGAMSLAQQIMIFKGARQVAGITGAGMTNIAFAAPGARVRLFVPRSMPDTFFWFIAQIRRHAYAEQRCPEINLSAEKSLRQPTWNSNIAVTPGDFRRFIEA